MVRRTVRVPRDRERLFDLFSVGRAGPSRRDRFTPAEIQQIARTVRRMPEVMVKVTGGGSTVGAVAAHFSYISRHGELEIESDYGDPVMGRAEQKTLLKDWHLDLTVGHYRPQRASKEAARSVKLVKNIALSMPAPTPPEKVLAAAKKFAREKFGASHRYAMVLHADQSHPHVHIVVKAEGEHGRRLHIDKQMLREWREDFARRMREQGVAANATPMAYRGRSKSEKKDAGYPVARHNQSTSIRSEVQPRAPGPSSADRIHGAHHARLEQMRKTTFARWKTVADILDSQAEISLAADVRYFLAQLQEAWAIRRGGEMGQQRSGFLEGRLHAGQARQPESPSR